MREIKFRAWSKNKNKFVNVVGFDLIKNTARLNCGLNIYCDVSLDNLDIDLFTGKKDKNRKEIYEGDIICSVEDDYMYVIDNILPLSRFAWIDYSHPIGIKEANGEILTSNGIRENYSDDWVSNPEFYEVIGNIHNNPELLSKGK